MADLPYVENDGYVGHWVVDEIYVPSPIGEPSTFENGKRLYVKPNHYTKQITKIKECSDEVAKYFDISSDINLLSQAQINKMSMKQMRQYVKDHNIEMPKEKRPSGDYYGIDYRSAITSHNKRRLSNYYRNGRRWYTAFNASKNNRTIQPQNVQAVALCEELSPFNNVTIDIASLVCSQLSIEREWSEIFQVLSECNPESDCYDCTEVGRKISSSLIKIAALRIFADPEQSILELPVNSIDSYFPESRVGKFGMGFFSFLYWLIGHPQRKLYLYSWFEKDGVHCAYKATISEGKFGLEMNLRILESDVTQTGTFIYMDSIGDPFDESEVSNFTQQLRKLKHIRSTIISTLLDSETNTAYLTESAKGNSPRIIVCIEREKIYVEDYASGIPINVLLGSLLVPSISTKTIADKIKIPKGWKPSSRIEYAGYQMIILVSGVAVVQLGKTLERGIIIEMPPTTRLPVSRDDIILDTETASIFAEEIQKVLEESVVYFATFLAQKGLKSYIDYTFGELNETVTRRVLSNFEQKYIQRLVDVDAYPFVKSVYPKAIRSLTSNLAELEKGILSHVEFRTDVWNGKRVVTVNQMAKHIDTAGFATIVFVTQEYTQSKNWIVNGAMSYPQLNLTPVNVDYGDKKYNKYRANIPDKIKNSPYGDLYTSVVSRWDGLSVYFSHMPSYEEFVESYNFMISLLSIEDWRDVSYVILAKFDSYKGNPTYGGGKYSMLFQPIKSRCAFGKDAKYLSFRTESIKLCIESPEEGPCTIFGWQGTTTIAKLQAYVARIGRRIFNFEVLNQSILKYSFDIIDYTLCWWSIRESLLRIDFLNINDIIPDVQVDRFIKGFLTKIKDLKFSKNIIIGLNNDINYNSTNKLMSEVIEWIKMVSKSSSEVKINLQPHVGQEITFLSSTMIDYLFSHEADIDDLPKTFKRISKYKGGSKLQMMEIAINEGTTKEFVPAVLTELVQNSVDAIRSTSASNKMIGIYFTSDGDKMVMKVKDAVGMSPEAFLYVGVPFLSTKTASEIVTGEMGSGFFNVYRESSLVTITSWKDGIIRVSYDYPIEKDGRVVDVKRNISIGYYDADHGNGTSITVYSKPMNQEKIMEYLGSASHISEKVLQQVTAFSGIQMTINDVEFKMEKTYMFSAGYFDVYFTDKSMPSYIFTKGIPFTPLQNYYTEYHNDIQSEIDTGVIINIRHGGYTPVQTRTRINMPEDQKIIFEQVIKYIIVVKGLKMVKTVSRNLYTNMKATAPAMQLKMSYSKLDSFMMSRYPMNSFVMFGNLEPFSKDEFRHVSLGDYTNKMIDFVGDDDPKSNETSIKKEIKKIVHTSSTEVNKLVGDLMWEWISVKNETITQIATKKKIEERDPEPDKKDIPLTKIVKAFTDAYQETAIASKIKGWTKDTLKGAEGVISEESEWMAGWYTPSIKKIYINSYTWETPSKQLLQTLKKVVSVSGYQDLSNVEWEKIASFQFPASTLPHELEHARRGTTHEGSGHNPTTEALWPGDVARERNFDECVNDIYSRVISEGFYERFREKLKHI